MTLFYVTDELSQENQDDFYSLFNDQVCDFEENLDLNSCKKPKIIEYFKYGIIGNFFFFLQYNIFSLRRNCFRN